MNGFTNPKTYNMNSTTDMNYTTDMNSTTDIVNHNNISLIDIHTIQHSLKLSYKNLILHSFHFFLAKHLLDNHIIDSTTFQNILSIPLFLNPSNHTFNSLFLSNLKYFSYLSFLYRKPTVSSYAPSLLTNNIDKPRDLITTLVRLANDKNIPNAPTTPDKNSNKDIGNVPQAPIKQKRKYTRKPKVFSIQNELKNE